MPKELQMREELPELPRATRITSDYAVCATCACSWFQEIRVARVDRNKVLIPGQEVPKLTESMVLLKCAKCGELHEPTIATNTSHSYKMHREMIAELDSKLDTLNSSATEEAKKV